MAATLYGYALHSDVSFQRVREGPAPRGALAIRRAEHAIPRAHGHPVTSIEDQFAVHRDGEALSVWCAFTGTFALDPPQRCVRADASVPDGPALEHRLACAVLPLLLAERGDLALHASAVDAGGKAIALAGPSGRGKSTAAWALAGRGYPMLAEDGCVITSEPRGPHLWPGLAGVRLRDRDGRTVVADVSIGGTGAVPLGAVVLLGDRGGNAPVIDRVPAAEALTAMMPNTMHAQGPSLAAAFRGSAAIARTVPVMRGALPDDLARAPDHAERLLELVLARLD